MLDGLPRDSTRPTWSTTALIGLAVAAVAVTTAVVSSSSRGPSSDDVPRWTIDEIAVAERSDGVTQGFEVHDGLFLHSTGGYGSSTVRLEDSGGDVLVERELPDDEYAEGATVAGDSLWQITWREGVAYRRDVADLAVVERVEYDGEGWGLCFDADADRLVMSDGGSSLTLRDPVTFARTGRVDVTLDGRPVQGLNELECVDGVVWANVLGRDRILRVAPDGEVDAVVDVPSWSDAGDLNGIAHVGGDRFWLTGKNWPTRHLVAIRPP